MAWEDELDPDLLHELPYYLVAGIAYGALLTANPAFRWGGAAKTAEMIAPIEFVAKIPETALKLAPLPGDGRRDAPPKLGPGAYSPERKKAGAVKVAKPKPIVDAKALIAASVEKRRKFEAAKEAKAAAAEEARRLAAERARIQTEDRARKAEAARVETERRKEQARLATERRLERARAEAERRREQARLEAERRAAEKAERERQLAEAKAAKARRKAEISQTLATMAAPDEALAARVPAAAASRTSASKAGAAAALAEGGDAPGSGGTDVLDTPARGGGEGADEGGVSWSLEGDAGDRRVLRRTAPKSPDWVGTRGLDLTVAVRFQVLPDGRVKPGAVIQKTSGFPEIDRLALDALKGWRFDAAPAGKAAAEVWGRVTFRFTS